MERTGLFDRDVCLKLAWCGLWDEALIALGTTRSYRLASCTGGLSDRRILQRKISDGDVLELAMTRLDALVAGTPVIPDRLVSGVRSSQVFADLNGIVGIDEGEALLTALTVRAPESTTLISGDKRFIAALREQRPLLWIEISGRVLSFEHCLLAILNLYGPAFVIERVHPVRACDSTLELALGSEATCDEDSFVQALTSYDPGR